MKKVMYLSAVLFFVVGICFRMMNNKDESRMTCQEMKEVIGGACGSYCGSNGDGCDGGSQEGSCSLPDCEGSRKSSCKTAQQHCVSANTTASCTDTNTPCEGTYKIQSCTTKTKWDEQQNRVEYCDWDTGTSYSCGGHRTSCEEG